MPFWQEVILRTMLTFALMLIFTRLIGKRQISQMTYFDYITGITLGSLAAYAVLEETMHWTMPLLALSVWVACSIASEYAAVKSKNIRKLIEGEGTIFIKEGKILEDNLKKERYSTDELLEQLRQKNAFRTADVEFAVLEPSGNLSVLMKQENQPLTPANLGIKVPNLTEPQTIIMDGNIMDEPLATAGLSRAWLHTELEKIGVTAANVYLAQVDGFGQIYVDLYDDQLKVPAPSTLALLWATLNKCQADIELFALATQSTKAKSMYAEAAQQLSEQIQKRLDRF